MIEGHEAADLNQTEECEKNQFVEDQVVASLAWHLVSLLISFIPAIMFILISVLVIFSSAILPYTIALLVSLYPICMTIGQIIVAICMLPLRYLLLGGRAKAGWEKVNSKSFLRRQLATSLYHSSLNILNGTVVYHLVSRYIYGAKIDFKSSFTPRLDEPDLTSVGECVFGANGVLLRNTMFYPGGIARYGRVDISDQVMILDRAVVSPETSIKEKVMVAPITAVYEDTIQEEGTVLLGTPSLNLTRKAADVEMEITSEPLAHLLLQYFIFIYFKYIVLILTLSAFYANGIVFWKFYYYCDCDLGNSAAIGISFAIFPLSLLALVVVCLTLSLAIKWILIGNFKRFQSKGLMAVDSCDVFRWLIANQLIHTAAPFVLQLVDEFWLTATFWKMMGATIGTNSRIDPNVLLFEVDLLEIGDNCRVEEMATLFCHRFNDGGLKLERIVIPSNSYIQNRAVILPGSEVSDEHVTMLPLTPLNPGEKLTAGHWQGSPAERVNIKTGKLLPGAATRRSTMLSERSTISVSGIV
jgi:non-ribosomal peptide synthetase-like protein